MALVRNSGRNTYVRRGYYLYKVVKVLLTLETADHDVKDIQGQKQVVNQIHLQSNPRVNLYFSLKL